MSKKETTKTPAKKSAKSAAKTAVKPAAAKKAAAEAVAAKPAAKTAVKTAVVKKTAAKKAVPVAVAAPKKTVAKKAVKKAVKKAEKGRDLVTDEPGAVEVAAVLDEHKAEKAAMDAAQEREEVAEFKASQPASTDSEAEDETEAADFKGPEPKLERLQKILAKAGISSRRKAEELILGGRVQINGKVVLELGTKADPSRDHVRVDGKLLQGPERIRYFVLNKPKGFVTTVSDPEGRPTVMQFFATERERLYPVGRLDYLSEGLLLVTNDGELANKLTKAASGVEKTYLVKVAGQPTEDMLDVLRGGVVIERGRPGENTGRVRTAPAKIRQVRQGDNPWYEVIIIEGRNRELRKMFEEIGHHVEKIRRVGYGPLILDLEPGKMRELEAEEVQQLRLAADGKLKKKGKKSAAAGQLPTVAGKTVRYKKADGKPGYEPRVRPAVRPEFQSESKAEFKPEFKAVPKTSFKEPFNAGIKSEFKKEFKPGFKKEFKPREGGAARPAFKSDSRPDSRSDSRPEGRREFRPSSGRPEFKSGAGSGFKPGFKSAGRPAFGGKPRSNRPAEPPVTEYILPPRKGGPIDSESDFDTRSPHQGSGFNPDYKPGFKASEGGKPAFRSDRPGSKPAFRSDSRSDRPFKAGGSRGGGTQPLGRYNASDDDYVPKKTPGFRVEPVEDAPRSGGFDRSGSGRPSRPAAGGDRPYRPAGNRPAGPRAAGPRPTGDRPFRPRPDAGSGRPPFGGGSARPSSRPSSDGPPARRPKSFEGASDSPREFRPRESKSFGGPKKFAGAKPFGAKPFGGKPGGPRKFDSARPAPGGSNSVPSNKLGPDGQPRIKERHRNSFSGKNKGRPKPKAE